MGWREGWEMGTNDIRKECYTTWSGEVGETGVTTACVGSGRQNLIAGS
jgi:hypothetical protein